MSKSIKLVLVGAIFFIVSFIIAEIAYAGLKDWSWIDVIYMVVITVFGVGYGEVHPVDTPELKVWTIAVIVTGCTSLILMTGGFVQFLLEAQINRVLNNKKMSKEIKNLKDHVIVVGYGRVGRLLVEDLHEANHKVLIIDANSDVVENRELQHVPVIVGDATDEEVLTEAGIKRASTIAVVLPNDALNVFITLSARNLSSDLQIIARGEKPQTASKLRQAGANEVVMPAHSGAERIARMILRPASVKFAEGKKGAEALMTELTDLGLDLEEIPVGETSDYIGLSAEELERKRALLVLAIHREDQILRRTEEFVIEPGDNLIVIGHHGMLERLTV